MIKLLSTIMLIKSLNKLLKIVSANIGVKDIRTEYDFYN